MKRAWIVIPVHNRRETTLACLNHLRTIGDLEFFSVLVIDDGSTDGTSEAIATSFPGIEILKGDGNLWWTGAMALGMRRAFESGAEAICWLNDDCWPESGALWALLDESLGQPRGIVAPACFRAETDENIPNGFLGRRRVTATKSETRSVDGISGFCAMIPREVCEQIGFPDPRNFPHYFGDNAYALKATRAGFRCEVLGRARAALIAFAPPPELTKSGLGWHADYEREFVSPKSPRRLQTLFAYQRLKYGFILGTLIAGLRGAGWLVRLALGRARG